ncbi:MAG: hypothetical protein KH031_10085 [Clostridiales bacterium]|nr:hypothetical protein [Clostridiales bacterium]
MKHKEYTATIQLKNMESFIQHVINIRKKYGLKGVVTLDPCDPIMIELMTFPFEFESVLLKT